MLLLSIQQHWMRIENKIYSFNELSFCFFIPNSWKHPILHFEALYHAALHLHKWKTHQARTRTTHTFLLHITQRIWKLQILWSTKPQQSPAPYYIHIGDDRKRMYDKKVRIIKFITTVAQYKEYREIHFHENNFSTEWNFPFNMRAYALKVNEKAAYYSTPQTVPCIYMSYH